MKFPKLALAATVAFTGSALAADKPQVDPSYLPYEKPGILAKLAIGDTIHIKCMGTGSPTVILSAGMNGWAGDWRMVQPQIAKTTRACAWDRPGYGFSSGSAHPQNVQNTTAELEAALKIARIRGPYVVVGHSLGGLETLLFKDHNPHSVIGMVLVDPSIPDQHNRFDRAAPDYSKVLDSFHANLVALYGRCRAALKSGKLKLGGPDPEGCLGYSSDMPRVLSDPLLALDTNPLRFAAAESLQQNFTADGASAVNRRRNYGAMPLVILTSSRPEDLGDIPQAAKDQVPAQQAEWRRGHDDLAALSSRGTNRMVANSAHYIQFDQPKAVIDAVEEVVAAARSAKR
jgi:pimeloyl-ACP methyl ester carboxylesterase